MSGKVRGRILIINTTHLEKCGQTTERSGSDVDYSNIRRLFEDLKFDIVKSEDDLTNLTARVKLLLQPITT